MKFRCDRDALSEALQVVQRGVSSRPGIPALTGVLIEATDDGRLTLTTTDLEVSARLATDAQVSEAGIALVPARLLGDTVKSLSDAPVDVETDQRGPGAGPDEACDGDGVVVVGHGISLLSRRREEGQEEDPLQRVPTGIRGPIPARRSCGSGCGGQPSGCADRDGASRRP